MNKLFFLLLSVLVLSLDCNAQAASETYEYKPLLTEGKMWKVLVKKELYTDSYETYSVSGDTVVNNRTCKRIIVDNGKQTVSLAAFEEGKKFYCYYSNDVTPNLMLDFGLGKGDVAYYGLSESPIEDNVYVSDIDYIEVNGVLRKRIKIEPGFCETIYWVEGIGINRNLWADTTIAYMTGRKKYLYECYDNGKLIFSASDFNAANSINTVTADGKKDGAKYSINGMKLENNIKGHIYIKDGKKYMQK